MTLGGLAIAIGELVDDAIIDVENVVRRLRENARAARRRAAAAARGRLPREHRGPRLGRVRHPHHRARLPAAVPPERGRGAAARPLGFAYVVSLAASLVVALTLTPALCSWLLPNGAAVAAGRGAAAGAVAQGALRSRAGRALTHWRTVIVGCRRRCLSLAVVGIARGWAGRSCRSSTRAR